MSIQIENTEELNCVSVRKDSGETYIFLYDDTQESNRALLGTLTQFVHDPELDFCVLDSGGVLEGIKRNLQYFETREKINSLCEEVIYHLGTTRKRGVVCLIPQGFFPYLLPCAAKILHLLKEWHTETHILSPYQIEVVSKHGTRKRRISFAREGHITPNRQLWPLVDFRGVGE